MDKKIIINLAFMKWHIGCSGFSYKEWKSVFYPARLPQKEWFTYYSSRFSTLELNVTFYRFPRLTLLQNWYTRSPVDFSFSVKAPKLITHFKQLKDCKELLADFYTTCRDGLNEKLGPLLFQFPPVFTYSDERMDRIVNSMDPAFMNVVEFRHSSWWNKKIYKRLQKYNIIFSGISYPDLPADVVVNNENSYYRFHGIPRLYYSAYDNAVLKKTAGAMLKQKKVKQVFCYFNNTAAVGAIDNALWMKKYTGSE